MKTNGLELNVNDLIDEVIRLTEEKVLAEAKAEYYKRQIDTMTTLSGGGGDFVGSQIGAMNK